MFKNRQTGEFMYPIIDYFNYSVGRSGRVYLSHRQTGNADQMQDYTEVPYYNYDGKKYVKLVNSHTGKEETLLVARLVLDSVYGEINFKIKYNSDDMTKVNRENLYYRVTGEKELDTIIDNSEERHGKFLILSDEDGNKEVFIAVPDHVIYNNGKFWISKNGVIYDRSRKIFITRSNDNHGYYKVALIQANRIIDNRFISGVSITLKVHSVNYYSWHPTEDSQGWTIDHLDGNRCNNRLCNLERVTYQENIRRQHNKHYADENIKSSRWTEDEADYVCSLLQGGKSYAEIAADLGYPYDDKTNKDYIAVRNFCKSLMDKRVFTDISENYTLPTSSLVDRYGDKYIPPKIFNEDDVRKVCELLVGGYNPKTVYNMINEKVSMGTIYGIACGKQYKEIAATVPGMDQVTGSSRSYKKYAPKSKYSEESIRKACSYLIKGYTPSEVVEFMNNELPLTVVADIKRGKAYPHITCTIPEMQEVINNKFLTVFTDKMAEEYGRKIKEYDNYQDIIRSFGELSSPSDKKYKNMLHFIKKVRFEPKYQWVRDKYGIEGKVFTNDSSENLDDDTVKKIARRLIEGASTEDIMNEFGIYKNLVYGIKRGKTYRSVTQNIPGMEKLFNERSVEVLTPERAEEYCKLIAEGKSTKEIATAVGIPADWRDGKYDVLRKQISRIKKGKQFKDIAEKYNIIETSAAYISFINYSSLNRLIPFKSITVE